MSEASPVLTQSSSRKLAFGAAIAGWLVPGFGHLILQRWGRAIVFFLSVGALALTGVLLRGNIFSTHSTDAFDFLGFLADIGTGVFYFAAKSIEKIGPDVSRAAGDYGTRFLATAGVINVLCALDAYEIGAGKKN